MRGVILALMLLAWSRAWKISPENGNRRQIGSNADDRAIKKDATSIVTKGKLAGLGLGVVLGFSSSFDVFSSMPVAAASAVSYVPVSSVEEDKTKTSVDGLFPEAAEDENNSAVESASSSTRIKKKKIKNDLAEKGVPTEGEVSCEYT